MFKCNTVLTEPTDVDNLVLFYRGNVLSWQIDGHTAQAKLWEWVFSGDLELHSLSTFEIARMSELMKKYADTPMDLADASLMVVAESRNIRQILTLDSDFYVYRKANGTALQCLP